MEFIKKEGNITTVKIPKTLELEEKKYSDEFLERKIPELQKEYDRRLSIANEVKTELDMLIKIKEYGEKESDNNKLG